MTKMKTKSFKQWGFPVHIAYIKDDDKNHKFRGSDFASEDAACTYEFCQNNECSFGIAFRTTDIDTMAHEVHHLFFMMLSHLQEEGWETFGTLGSEIYAYSFGELFKNVRKSLEKLSSDIEEDK